MARSRSQRRIPHREATRNGPSRRARGRPPGGSADEQELILMLREAMRSRGGSDLLRAVGMIMEALPGISTLRARHTDAVPQGFAGFVETLLDINLAETTAVLHVARSFTDDEVLRARIERELSRRTQPMPPVVAGLGEVRILDAWLLSDALRDVDSLVLGIDGPRGTPRACVVQVHHDVAAITDAFLTDDTAYQVRQRFVDVFARDDVDGVVVALSLADARAHVENLLRVGAGMPTPETGTWPGCRPFLRYLCRGLPEGGSGYRVDAPEDDELAAVVDQLLASTAGRRAGLEQDRELVACMVGFAASAGLVEPWRWSPRRVSEFLLEWLPSTDPAALRQPDRMLAVLRVVVAEAGRHEGLPRRQVVTTLGAIDVVAAEFRRLAARHAARPPASDEG